MILSIQLLRAISAIVILLYHVLVNQYNDIAPVKILSAGVPIFFVISGYIIARSTEATTNPWHFLARRFLRIYPVWWVALTLWLVGSGLVLGENPPLSKIMTSLALISTWDEKYQAFAPTYHIGWTLCYEVIFYTLWAFSLAVTARTRVTPLFVTAGLIGGLIVCVRIALEVMPGVEDLRPYGSFYMLEFLAGAGIRQAERSGLLTAANVALGRWYRRACAGVAMVGFGLCALGVLPIRPAYDGLAVLTFLAFLSTRVEASSVLGRFSAYLGDASYSLYLFHAMLLDLAFVHTGILTPGDHNLVNAVVAFATCFAFSLAMYHLVEKPCVLFGKYLTSGWRHPLKA